MDSRTSAEISQLLASPSSVGSRWRTVALKIAEIVESDFVQLVTVDQVRGSAVEAGNSDSESRVRFESTSVPYVQLPDQIAQTLEPWMPTLAELESTAESNEFEAEYWKSGFRSLISVTVYWDEVRVGNILARSKSPGAFTDEHANELASVAGVISPSLFSWRNELVAQREASQRANLAALGRESGTAKSLQELGDAISPLIRNLISCNYIAFNLFEEDGPLYRVAYVSSERDVDGLTVGETRGFEGSLFGIVSGDKSPTTIGADNWDEWIDRVPSMQRTREGGISRGIVAPMISGENHIGVLGVADFEGEFYWPDESELIQQVADQIAPVIDNLQLKINLERQRTRSELLGRLAGRLDSRLTLDEIHDLLATELGKAFSFERFVVGYLDGLPHRYESGIPIAQDRIDRSAVLDRFSWRQNDPRAVIDVVGEDSDNPVDVTALEVGIRSRLRVAIGTPPHHFGHIILASTRPDAFTADDAELLEQISLVVSPVILGARERATIGRMAAEQEALVDIGTLIGSDQEVTDSIMRVGERVNALVDIDEISVALVDQETGLYTEYRLTGVSEKATLTTTTDIDPETRHLERTVELSQTVLRVPTLGMNHEQPEESIGELDQEGHTGAVIAAPMLSSGLSLGVVSIRSQRRNDAYALSENFVRGLAAHLAGAFSLDNVNNRLKEELREQRALTEISRLVDSADRIDGVFSSIAEIVALIIPCDRMFISTIDFESDTSHVIHSWGVQYPTVEAGAVIPMPGSQIEMIAKSKLTIHLGEYNFDDYLRTVPRLKVDDDAGLRSQITVPLVVDGKVSGVLGVRSLKPDAYTSRNVQFTQGFASQLAGAVENDRLRSELERNARQDRALAEISRLAGSELDLDRLYSRLADALDGVIQFDRLAIATVSENESGEPVDTVALVRGIPIDDYEPGDSMPSHDNVEPALQGSQSLDINHAQIYPVIEGSLLFEYLTPRGLRSRLRALIGFGDERLAIVSILSRSESAYDQRDVDFMIRVCEQIAPSVANARQYEQTVQLASEQEILAEINRSVNQNLNLYDIYKDLGAQLAEVVPHERMAISSWAPEWSTIEYVQGEAIEGLGVGTRFRSDEYVSPEVNDRTLTVDLVESRYRQLFVDKGFKSRIQVLIGPEDRPLGLLALVRTSKDGFTRTEEKLLKRMANEIAPAFTNARQYAEAQRLSNERRLIADIGRSVASSLQTDTVFQTLRDGLEGVLEFDELVIATSDLKNGIVTQLYTTEKEPAKQVPLDGTITQEVVEQDTAITIDATDVESTLERYPALEPTVKAGVQSYCISPLRSEGQIFGVISLHSRSAHTYSDRSSELLQSIGDQIAPAIVTAEFSRTQETLARISEAINENLDLADLYSRLATELESAIPHERLTISRWGEELSEIVFVSGMKFKEFPIGTLFDTSPYKVLENNGKSYSLLNDPQVLAFAGMSSRIFVLVGQPSQPMAIIALVKKSPLGFTAAEERLLVQIANLVSPVFSNAIEHEEVVLLRDSYEQAQLALDSTSDMVGILDSEMRFIYVNDAWTRISGFDRKEILGRRPPVQDVESGDALAVEYLETLRRGDFWSGTRTTHRKDGTSYQEQATTTPVRDENGVTTNYIIIKRDVSELLETEAMISQAATKQDLVATVEHEIRSPLAAVVNYIDLLRRSDDKSPRVMDRLKTSATELVSTVNELRDIVSGRNSTLELNRSNVDLVDVVKEASEPHGFLVQTKNLELLINADEVSGSAPMHLDETKIRQVFNNLIGNAVRYTPDNGRIDITFDKNERFTRVSIYNTGAGVGEEDLNMITQMYFRGSSSTNSSELGSGIGLAVSDAIVKAHAGHMVVRSRENEFFEVEVLLPNSVERN